MARLTLCRPKKLNSLSLPMISQLREKYDGLAPSVRCILLAGEGRALCAGGDVAEVREGVLQGNSAPADFFYDEYALDYQIATLHERKSVLQVALWDGIVMGGGVGLSIHSPIRIATEKTLFAMPETGIGLFPDVGTTWMLSRISAGERVGVFLGITGHRLGAADCLRAGLATHYCPSERLGAVEEGLRALGDGAADLEAASAAVMAAAGGAEPSESKAVLGANAATIERCFAAESAEEILGRLEAESADWATGVAATLRQKSPTSVKLSLEGIRRHRSVSLKEAFTMEYRMAQWCMRPQPHSDFCEGIRSVLVDKDNAPRWEPSRLEDVTPERVEGFFAPLPSSHARGELIL